LEEGISGTNSNHGNLGKGKINRKYGKESRQIKYDENIP
jgi:hypothetical protein